MKIITNNIPREILSASDLTPKELSKFDYLEPNEGSFFRYRGWVYDLGEFIVSTWSTRNPLSQWDSYSGPLRSLSCVSYFSVIVVKYPNSGEGIIVGTASYL
jgi:hypothetical protein